VDEVLAVGDVQFQKKCLGKIENVAHEGRTVLFVSHNMASVRSLCKRGVHLEAGRVCCEGSVGTCIENYYRAVGAFPTTNEPATNGDSVFGTILVNSGNGNTIEQSDDLKLVTTLRIQRPVVGFNICCLLEDVSGRPMFRLDADNRNCALDELQLGEYELSLCVPRLWLSPGVYSLRFIVNFWGDSQSSRYVSDAFPLDVSGVSPRYDAVMHPPAEWSARRRSG
jgi:lipopolysaccharide transport system ATP-binding protein